MSTTTNNKTWPKVIELNVGGRNFSTTKSTLCKYPDSMLARMFGGNFELVQDSTGRYFIDRDGELFGHILNFLRNDKILIPASKRDMAEDLLAEADFYGIEPLINYLKEVVEEIEAERNRVTNSKVFYNELRQASLKKWQDYANNVFDTCFPDIKEKLIKTATESNIMNCIIIFHQATTDESINQVTVERSIGNCWNNPNVAIGGTIKINVKVRYAQISIPNGYSAMQMNAVAEVWCDKLEKLGFDGVKYKAHPFEIYFRWSKYLTENFVRLIN